MKKNYSISVWTTSRCNFRCTYCYEKTKHGVEDMTLATADRIVDFVKEEVKEGQLLSIQFHGGEPMLNFEVVKHIVERVEKEIPNEKRFGITTNCSLLDNEKVEFICEHMPRGISLSIDGDKETHELNRKCIIGNCEYDEILAIALKIKEKVKNVRIRMTYTPKTAPLLFKNVKYMVELGFKEIVPIADFYSKDWTTDDFDIVECQFKKIKQYKIENKKEVYDFNELTSEFKKKGICSGGKEHYSVNVNGDIYPCMMVVGDEKHRIGNIFTGFDYDMINSIVCINNDRLQVEGCKDCNLFDYCDSTRCLLVNYAINGNYYKPNLVNCNIMNIKYNLCDYLCDYSHFEHDEMATL